ncbi:glycosyltransferase family 2 protein [Salipiger mucosus]|uniref:Glycosyltransferase 2-like domain-containing protein n=1 Tax=Salipiger mucosus DSM 16094 TaxID=1123237 RepID=S9Q2P0_9RHOB|nr:glycosyltransferase family 2 protein [Salipiger mucosus]EPX75546.1 hypothetical protein Salmuc_03180 [Salipiger mucosus DSM 16094]
MLPEAGPPAVEVIVRAHDPESLPLLRRALASVAAQAGAGRVRVLLETSNFGPLPGPDALFEPGAPRVEVIHTDVPHAGDSRFTLLRNGIRRARADWLHVLDCDDALQPDGLARMRAAGEAAGARLVIANADLLREDARGGVSRTPYRQGALSVPGLVRRNEVPFNAILVRREAALAAIARSPALSLFEDYGFLLNLLAQRPPLVLPPEVRVADYHVSGDQGAKYAQVRDFSMQVIDRLRAGLVFPVPGEQLLAHEAAPVHERAFAELLAALPEAPLEESPVQAYLEALRPVDGGLQVEGWCVDTSAPGTPLWGVYAQIDESRAVLLDTRETRADVSAATGAEGRLQGFSGPVPAPGIETVWLVHAGRRLRLGP